VTTPPAASGESIGARLRRLRRERGLSQRQLSGPGVTAAYISRIEAGARTPSVKALRVLAAKLAVSAEYLETGIELREADARELRLVDAELELRLTDDPAALEPRFRALLGDAIAAQDRAGEARARLGLGVIAARAGDHTAAVAQLEDVVSSDLVSPLSRGDAYTTLARSYRTSGAPRRAAQLLERSLEQVRTTEPHDVVSELRLATALRSALTEVGDVARARDVVQDALLRAGEVADPYSRVRVHWSRGRAASEDNDVAAALGHFRRALGLLEATDETLHLARAYLACSELLTEEGQADESLAQLELARQLLGPRPAAVDAARLRTQQASTALRTGALAEAAAWAREALDVRGESKPAQRARAFRVLAEALAASHDTNAALDAFRQSTDLFESAGHLHDAADVARAWATLLRSAGRDVDALDVLERAADLATHAARL